MRIERILAILILVIGFTGSTFADIPYDWNKADTQRGLGSASWDYANGVWTIVGQGQYGLFVYKSLIGDGSITARVRSLTGASSVGNYDKPQISVAIHRSPTSWDYPGTARAGIQTDNGANSTFFGYRHENQGGTKGGGVVSLPYWIRVERKGNTFSGYVSPNGNPNSWTLINSEEITMDQEAYIGLNIWIHSPYIEFTAELDNVMLEGSVGHVSGVSDQDWRVSNRNMYSIPLGNVGIGTTDPISKLDVLDTSSNPTIIAVNDGHDDSTGVMGFASNTGDVQNYGGFFVSEGKSGVGVSALSTGSEGIGALTMGTGAGGTGILASGELLAGFFDGSVIITGDLDVNGSIYQRGNRLHADYVFEPDYELESIDEHSQFMWQHGHLESIPKAQVDGNGQEIVEIGTHQRGIVEELEKAHIYIEQLNNRIKILEEKLAKPEAG
ncbi:hypothetical protein ACFL3Q_15220 [Planctomycetota bacterium]